MSNSQEKSLGELEAELESLRLEKAAHEEELRMEPNLVSNRPARWRYLRNQVEALKTKIFKTEELKKTTRDYIEWDRSTRERSTRS